MKTVAQIQVCDGGTADVMYGWESNPDGSGLTMHIEAVALDAETRVTWEDQFALLDTVWIALVDVRRLAMRHARTRRHRDRTQSSRA